MEKDLSFILLVIAGLVLLILFIYSLKTRVRPGRRTQLEHDVLGVGQNDNDILSMPLNTQASEPYIGTEALKATVNDAVSQKKFAEPAKVKNVALEKVEAEKASTEFVEPQIKKTKQPAAYSKLIVLNVMPQEGRKFIGYELLQALLATNLRHGAMSIFHRHEAAMGDGKILFSVAQITEPGTFSLDAMRSCQCSGLTMFMQLTGPEHNLKAYEMFIQAAQQIADNLRGVLVDANRAALTADSTRQFKAQVQAHLKSLGINA